MSNEKTEEVFNFKDKESWQSFINKAPNDKWVKTRDLGANKKSTYIPIPIQQAVADVVFDEFDIFDESYQQVCNEILCTVKISILPSYPNSEHRTISGTGAKPISARSGSLVEKFPRGKITNSLEYCAPNARTSAIGNALATFGNIFGRNLGRAVSADYSFLNREAPEKKVKKSKKNKADEKK